MSLSIMAVLGTRPEIIKFSPLIRATNGRDVDLSVVHTGQHYSPELSQSFFSKLGLPEPDENLEVGSTTHGQQTAQIIQDVEQLLFDLGPDVVVVQGDTNSTLGGGLAAAKQDPELAHIEAGLRSFNREMPEEDNRVVVDHLSDYLFAPTDTAAARLRSEGISDDRIFVTGNTVVDAVVTHRDIAATESIILSELGLEDEFGLLTAHRAENTDDPKRLQEILDGIGQFGLEMDMQIVYPIHPRAKEVIEGAQIEVPRKIRIIEPLDYLDFLKLESEASVAFTDSGGVQEEACILGTPCVTVREETERPETVEIGANRIGGIESETVLRAGLEAVRTDRSWDNPLGDGNAGRRVLDLLLDSVED